MSVGHSVTAVFNGVLHPFLSIPEVTPLTRLHAPATHLIAHKGLKTLTSYKVRFTKFRILARVRSRADAMPHHNLLP